MKQQQLTPQQHNDFNNRMTEAMKWQKVPKDWISGDVDRVLHMTMNQKGAITLTLDINEFLDMLFTKAADWDLLQLKAVLPHAIYLAPATYGDTVEYMNTTKEMLALNEKILALEQPIQESVLASMKIIKPSSIIQ